MTQAGKGLSFPERMTRMLNEGALNLACALGYSLGLFEAMDSLGAPADAATIATEAGLDKRYVYEWLCAMAAGDIVESFAPLTEDDGMQRNERFLLPAEHAAVLTRKAGSANMGVYTQEMPLLTQCAMDAVQQGFSTGEGVPYANYPRFQQFMGELAEAKQRKEFVGTFLPAIENGALYKRLEAGIDVCDVGCAEGEAVLLMAQAFPNSRFMGMDIDPEALTTARNKVAAAGCDNATFSLVDVAKAKDGGGWHGAFDYMIALDAIHDQTHPMQALESIQVMLRQGGRFSMVDIAAESDLSSNLEHPMAPFLYMVSLMHCMPVGLYDGGAGLGMMWGRKRALHMLSAAGFSEVEVSPVPNDSFNLHYYCRKG